MNRDEALAAGATVLTEDGLWLRTCEHGVRHPIGRFVGRFTESEVSNGPHDANTQRHERNGDLKGYYKCACDGCCADYPRQEYAL